MSKLLRLATRLFSEGDGGNEEPKSAWASPLMKEEDDAARVKRMRWIVNADVGETTNVICMKPLSSNKRTA